MPWQLTTPYSVGDLDAADYDQVKITGFRFDTEQRLMIVELQYGTTVGGSWKPGLNPSGKPVSVLIRGTDFDDLVATHTSNDGELTYDAVVRVAQL